MSPTATPSATPSATTPAVEPALTYLPDGSAFDNKAYFDHVLLPVAEAGHPSPSKAMVEALVAAGFPKSSIETSPDKTKTGLDADSVFVAVRIGKQCLIGQRTSGREFASSVESGLKVGECLIGALRK